MHIFGTLLEFVTSIRGREDGLSRGRCTWRHVSKRFSPSIHSRAGGCLPSLSRLTALFRAAIVSAISACCEGIVMVEAI